MEKKEFKYFYIQQSSDTQLKVQCLFEEIDQNILEEANAIFQLIALGTSFNVNLSLQKILFLNSTFINTILNFALDLKELNRSLSVSYPTESFIHYLIRFGFEKLIEVEEI